MAQSELFSWKYHSPSLHWENGISENGNTELIAERENKWRENDALGREEGLEAVSNLQVWTGSTFWISLTSLFCSTTNHLIEMHPGVFLYLYHANMKTCRRPQRSFPYSRNDGEPSVPPLSAFTSWWCTWRHLCRAGVSHRAQPEQHPSRR